MLCFYNKGNTPGEQLGPWLGSVSLDLASTVALGRGVVTAKWT